MAEARADRFADWLQAHGIEGSRRIVRTTETGVLVSKFEPGFAARLHDALDHLPELFDEAAIRARYVAADPSLGRPEAWRIAVGDLLAELGPQRGLTRDQVSEIQAGVDSVAALLDSALWTGPTVGAEWTPSPAERQAYDEVLARMDDESSIFTRFYGEFEGTPVYNHCPGSQTARRLMAQAWAIVSRHG